MRIDSQMREAAWAAGTPGAPQPTSLKPLVRPPALLDVMMEQIEYLAGHAAEACPSGCAECVRLEQVKHWLLAPFH